MPILIFVPCKGYAFNPQPEPPGKALIFSIGGTPLATTLTGAEGKVDYKVSNAVEAKLIAITFADDDPWETTKKRL